MRLFSSFLTGAAVAGSLLSGTDAWAQQVTLDILYAQPSFAQFHEPIAAEFMKKNPNVKISFRAPSPNYDEGHQLMLRQMMTNQLPDVYFPGYHLLAELTDKLAPRGQVVDLQPLLDKEPADWRKANFSDAVLELGKVNGKLYGLAFAASLPITYVNEDLVRKAGGDPKRMPDNWNDTIALAAKIKALGGDTVGIAYNVHEWPDDWLWRAIVQQGGGNMVEGNKAAFGGAPGLNALKTLRRMVTEGGMPMIDWEQSRQLFIAGQIGIYFDTPARLKQITSNVGTKFTLGTAPFPVDDKAKGGLPTGGAAGIIMTKDAAKQAAAWEYIKFVAGPQAQKIVVETTGYMPTNQLALGKDYLGPFYDANPNFKTVANQGARAFPWQGYPGGNTVRIWRTQRDVINSVMRGDTAPEAGLEKLLNETNALIR